MDVYSYSDHALARLHQRSKERPNRCDSSSRYLDPTAFTVKPAGWKSGVLPEWDDLTPELASYFVRNGVSVTPTFRNTETSDAELAALADYVANAGCKKEDD